MVKIYGVTRVIWSEDDTSKFVKTVFWDGTHVMARPFDEPWEYTSLHDPLHTILAWDLRRLVSPSLWKVAHPEDETTPAWQLAYEETAVIAQVDYLVKIGFSYGSL